MLGKIEREKRVNDWKYWVDSLEHFYHVALNSHGVYLFNYGSVLRNTERWNILVYQVGKLWSICFWYYSKLFNRTVWRRESTQEYLLNHSILCGKLFHPGHQQLTDLSLGYCGSNKFEFIGTDRIYHQIVRESEKNWEVGIFVYKFFWKRTILFSLQNYLDQFCHWTCTLYPPQPDGWSLSSRKLVD